nr:glycosyltransferase family 4 protein [uncultured Blautia sp.]
MKIAIVSPGRLPVPAVEGGAVESLIDVFLKYSKISEDEIWVFSGSENVSREFSDGNIHYFQLKRLSIKKSFFSRLIQHYCPLVYDIEYLNYIIKVLKNVKIDCIIVENRPLFVGKFKNAINVPIYLHMHNDALLGKKNEIKSIEKCSGILAVSNYIKSCVKKKYLKVPISVIYNGISIHRFSPNGNIKEKEQIRKKYAIAPNDIVICFAGRFIESKGVLELVQAYSKLKYFENVKLVIMGSSWYGTSTSNPYIEKVRKEAEKCKNKIVFTGYLDNDKVAELEAVSDIAVLPSMWEEPLGLSVLEAMASGLAVISTISGGIPEIINEDSGILLNRNNKLLDNMAFYLEKLIMDEKYRKVLGKNARKRIEEHFTEEQYYKCIREALKIK